MRAKEEERAQARRLRAQGQSYTEIAARLGVSKSSVSLWVRDLPTPPRLSHEENRRRSAEGTRRYWARALAPDQHDRYRGGEGSSLAAR